MEQSSHRPLPYNDYGRWIRQRMGMRIQKLPVNAGFSCPNRDGRLSDLGCAFCDNKSFTPPYCQPGDSITEQLESGKRFFSRKYPDAGYLAYFQSFTNTYADTDILRERYEEALAVEGIRGIVISTRPDCLSDSCLDYLERLGRRTFLTVEIGIESMNDNTLKRMNRRHDTSCVRQATEALSSRGIITCGHVILGLPGEHEEEILQQARQISRLPIQILKIHQLQVLRGTALAQYWKQCDCLISTPDEYLSLLAQYICRLRSDLILERFFSSSPIPMVIAPQWGIRPSILNQQLAQLMWDKGWYQGALHSDFRIHPPKSRIKNDYCEPIIAFSKKNTIFANEKKNLTDETDH